MGNTSSIFFPDNPKRRNRAEQLANDCQNFKNEFDVKHNEVEAILGPYKEKLDRVLHAFGCTNLDDLDRVVQQRATGQALDDWNKTKDIYDKTQVVDQVIMGAMGTVAIAGLAISSVGALAGGFGFFVGLAVTADILLVLGVIGAIFDIVNGAIQRSKLRDAIESLFENRIKIKHVLAHIDNLFVWLPIITEIYKTYEEVDFDPDQIVERFKTKGLMKPLQEDLRDETFLKAANDLSELDRSRDSWTDEDPNWQDIVHRLEPVSPPLVHPVALAARAAPARFLADIPIESEKPLPHDASIKVKLWPTTPLEIPNLTKPLEMILLGFPDEKTAEVLFRTDANHYVSIDHHRGKLLPGSEAQCSHVAHWLITLVDPDYNHSPTDDSSQTQAEVTISTEDYGMRWYMDANGDLVSDSDGPETLFLRYA